VLVRVRAVEDETTATNRFWLWAAGDNLKLSAVNAVACAVEMRRLRPTGHVQ
jgi:aspartate-semialdehyde dehydrogenase